MCCVNMGAMIMLELAELGRARAHQLDLLSGKQKEGDPIERKKEGEREKFK